MFNCKRSMKCNYIPTQYPIIVSPIKYLILRFNIAGSTQKQIETFAQDLGYVSELLNRTTDQGYGSSRILTKSSRWIRIRKKHLHPDPVKNRTLTGTGSLVLPAGPPSRGRPPPCPPLQPLNITFIRRVVRIVSGVIRDYQTQHS